MLSVHDLPHLTQMKHSPQNLRYIESNSTRKQGITGSKVFPIVEVAGKREMHIYNSSSPETGQNLSNHQTLSRCMSCSTSGVHPLQLEFCSAQCCIPPPLCPVTPAPTPLHCTAPHRGARPALPCSALPCSALPCPALPCSALPCPALPCPALPYPPRCAALRRAVIV